MIHLAQEERNKTFTDDNTMRWDSGEVRRREAPPRQRKHPRKPPKRKGTGAGYYVTILVISAILAGVGWLMCNDLLALNKKDHLAEIVVTDGEKLGSVSKSLKKEGLINYRGLFLLYSSLSDTEVVAGTYELNTSMDYHALLTAMSARSGARKTVNVTIPEGYSMQQIFELLEEKNVNTVEALTEAAANEDYDYDFLANKEKGDASRLEGYLFPDTYQFYSGGDAKTVINKMLRNFDNKMTNELRQTISDSGYTMDEIITIASLIEKETDGSDGTKISSVIRNRLKNSGETAGYLQIDAALLYALGEHKEVLTDADKEIDSPYNLYKNKGLPPTPICNPGMASIRSALYPDNTSYYFYALGEDGVHHFFKTYREHLNFLESLKN
ncbi:endolytic transglycosylase MltG [bacterium 210917-DFI.7.65]|nr:endolytic transglycosylase MltG [bacterium 210917-DFI.7.65]